MFWTLFTSELIVDCTLYKLEWLISNQGFLWCISMWMKCFYVVFNLWSSLFICHMFFSGEVCGLESFRSPHVSLKPGGILKWAHLPHLVGWGVTAAAVYEHLSWPMLYNRDRNKFDLHVWLSLELFILLLVSGFPLVMESQGILYFWRKSGNIKEFWY